MTKSTRSLILILALALAGAGMPVAAGGRAVVTQVAVKVFPGRVLVGVVASGPVSYQAMALANPDRVVVDIVGATNGLSWSTLPVHQGAVAQVRVGQFTDSPPVMRMVVDLLQPVKYLVTMPNPDTVVAAFPGPSPAQGSAAKGRPVSAGPGIEMVAQPSGQASPARLNLDLRDAALTDVLDALARLCGVNLVTDASVAGRVTIHLVGVTCQEAMNFMLEANALGYRRVGETLIVEAASKLTPPPPGPVVRVYKLQYLQPPVASPEPLVGSVGSGAAGGSGISGGAGRVPKDVGAILDLFRGTGATVGYDDRTNSLVVTGTPSQQEAMAALLTQLDVPIGQVQVQATVVDITSNRLKDLGIEWTVLQGATGTPFTFQEVPAAGVTVGATPPGQVLSLLPITRDQLLARLHAFITEGHAKVLSDPRISTFDGQEALIFAGDQVPIVNTTTAGNPPVTTSTVTFQPIGVTLKIVPKVNADHSITVQVHPVVTTVTSFTAPTTSNPNGLPQIAIREAVTTLSVADGESIVLGGLMRFSDIQNLKKVPLLGDLPFIGSLFRLTNVNHQESEVVIIMTPRILSTPGPGR
jgi:type IV pilus assembly protein PilQ